MEIIYAPLRNFDNIVIPPNFTILYQEATQLGDFIKYHSDVIMLLTSLTEK